MVAEIEVGTNINGIIQYNENKVSNKVAKLIDAVGFGCGILDLSIKGKRNRFSELLSKNRNCKSNAIHISLNFHPSEKISKRRLCEIASMYMDKIGFGDQPYLLYKHTDAAHPHVHICTTNIKEDGKRIPLDFIGLKKSMPACAEIERQFGLVVAKNVKSENKPILKPLELEILKYGQFPTKAAISGRVRSVFKYCSFESFSEFSAILRELNILADLGEIGSKQREYGGLVYYAIDGNGEKIGKGIKASSIADSPILKRVEAKYLKNRGNKKVYAARVTKTIELILKNMINLEEFKRELKKEDISLIIYRNKENVIYGLSFLDFKTNCIFKGSDLGKNYSASRLLSRVPDTANTEIANNFLKAKDALLGTSFSEGLPKVISKWYLQGVSIVERPVGEENEYFMGTKKSPLKCYVSVDKRLNGYFRANGFQGKISERIYSKLDDLIQSYSGDYSKEALVEQMVKCIESVLGYTYTENYLPYWLLQESEKKKRKKGRRF